MAIVGGSRRCARGRGAPRGFTLIEILVALAILTLVLGAALEGFSRGLRALGTAREYDEATAVARSAMEEALAGGEPPGERAGVTVLGEGARRYRWRVSVAPYPGDDLGPTSGTAVELGEVRVEVAWGEGRRGRRVDLYTLAVLGR